MTRCAARAPVLMRPKGEPASEADKAKGCGLI